MASADLPVTSFDAARPGVFGDMFNRPRTPPAPFRVGLLAAGYFEYWRMYPELKPRIESDLAGIAGRLQAAAEARGLAFLYPGPVDTLDAAEAAGDAFARAGVDLVAVAWGTYVPDFMLLHALEKVPHARVVLFNTQTGAAVNPDDDYPATMRNSALIGATQLSGSLTKAGRPYKAVAAVKDDEAAYARVARMAAAHDAARRLRTWNVGLVGSVFRGMFDLEFDRGLVRGRLGPEVVTIGAEHLAALWKEVDPAASRAKAGDYARRFELRGVAAGDVERSVRVGLALRALAKRYRLDGLCFLGQHHLEKITGAPVRLGASLLMEEDDFPVACEGDVGGLVMMGLLRRLTGAKPLQLEWGQFDLAQNALFLLGHGIACPSAGGPAAEVKIVPAPEEWGFEGAGANWELRLAPGPVTMGHFLAGPGGWRMLVSRGESLAGPRLPCCEIHAVVKVRAPVTEYLERLMAAGATHHVALAGGDAADALETAAEAMGVAATRIE